MGTLEVKLMPTPIKLRVALSLIIICEEGWVKVRVSEGWEGSRLIVNAMEAGRTNRPGKLRSDWSIIVRF